MTSAGDVVERFLRVVRVHIDALGEPLDEALLHVPEEHRDAVRVRWEEETALPIRRVHILSERGGPRAWFENWDPSAGYYWRQQRTYLIDHIGWARPDVESLDDATDRILSHLEDPRPEGPPEFSVRGLVMGYVQSGKTANFCALVAKAADLGYKLVIVLSGIHNSLRLQTQRRINRALGLDPSGVPVPEAGRRWISLTTDNLYGDFRPGTIDANILQGNERVLLVVKKNASVLRRLTRWMGHNAPPSLPVLIIDDEADQASVNTGGNRPPIEEETDLSPADVDDPNAADEIDPSVINGQIRSLVTAFRRVCYVAYTATPFANILINHLAIDREVFEDLYPKDFIVTLPRPNGYTGAERLFGREPLPGEAEEAQPGLDVIEVVPDHEADQLTPSGRDVTSYVPRICPSMRTAFIDFVLAIAGRHQRTGQDGPASMLVHTHHRTPVQNQLGQIVRDHVSELRQSWRYDRASIRSVLEDRWNQRFRRVIASVNVGNDVPFEAVEEYIDRLFRDPVPVLVLNSASEDQLDYEADRNLKAVIIGGNRLSRGLTLEGLLVSYYVRRAECLDTLMQMGRWFGFREGYVDLTRIWTTGELAGWFRDLALAEEELRREIERYERENLTPLDFGPRIRSHPVMMITAKNKMGSARRVSQNYSGYMLQTTAFRLDETAWLQCNLAAAESFLQRIGSPQSTGVQPVWKGVPWQAVDTFLTDYRFDPRATHEMGAIRQYLQAQVRQGELTEWCVSVRGNATPDSNLGTEPRLAVGGTPPNRIGRTRLKSALHSIGSLVTPATMAGELGSGDETVGLTAEQLQAAREEARVIHNYPLALRHQRSSQEGLLLVYPISPYSRPRTDEGNRLPLFTNPEGICTVVGIAMVFPVSGSAATIEYVVGSVGDLSQEGQ